MALRCGSLVPGDCISLDLASKLPAASYSAKVSLHVGHYQTIAGSECNFVSGYRGWPPQFLRCHLSIHYFSLESILIRGFLLVPRLISVSLAASSASGQMDFVRCIHSTNLLRAPGFRNYLPSLNVGLAFYPRFSIEDPNLNNGVKILVFPIGLSTNLNEARIQARSNDLMEFIFENV